MKELSFANTFQQFKILEQRPIYNNYLTEREPVPLLTYLSNFIIHLIDFYSKQHMFTLLYQTFYLIGYTLHIYSPDIFFIRLFPKYFSTNILF